MKVSALIAAGAVGLVAAAPVRIIVFPLNGSPVAVHPEPKMNPTIQVVDANPFRAVRIGHAAAHAQIMPTPVPSWAPAPSAAVHGCGGLRAKMDRISDKARELLGLAPIDRLHHITYSQDGRTIMMEHAEFVKPVVHHHHHHHKVHGDHDRFVYRLHRALNQLGPWEGRAISFVLGCGIGVLIRMFFVLAVLFIRARRAAAASTTDAGPIHLAVDQVVFIAPPEYLAEDEKAPLYSAAPDAVELVVEEKDEPSA